MEGGYVLHRRIFCGVMYYIRKINTGVPPGLGGGIASIGGGGRGLYKSRADTNCLGRKVALWEARAVSNSGGPPAGAPKTQQKPLR